MVKSFAASVVLKPGLSVGTAQPESIYTAQLKSQFQASNPAGKGECEVLLPLPPQIHLAGRSGGDRQLPAQCSLQRCC